MAIRNHSLDDKIIEAATTEFLEFGFQGASLRRIAQRANLSTGALYTRYENKDALFCSIVKDILSEISHEFEPLQKGYMDAQKSNSVDAILEAIRQEERVYQKILLKYYDQCVLFFCQSDGSSLQAKLEEFMAYKAKETVAFLENISKKEVNADGVEILLLQQFYCYRAILQKRLSKEQTTACLKMVENFQEAGWKAFFRQIMK